MMPLPVYYRPHPGQLKIHLARHKRFRTICTGRRFGKTYCLAVEVLERGGMESAGDYGWLAPTYNVAERGIDAVRRIAGDLVKFVGRMPTRGEFTTKTGLVRIWFLSADNPDSIRGFGFKGLVIDEAAAIPVDVWHYAIRPTIAQTLGWAVFVSTPKGRNWFFDMFTRGEDPLETNYASFRFSSRESPFFPAAEWEEARRTLPEDVFRQEYEAEFLHDSAGVFRNVDACLIPDGIAAKDLKEGADPLCAMRSLAADLPRSVVIGCDVAKHTDWTVLIAMDAETGACFAMERFNHLDWNIQKERIVTFARAHRGRVILDATGVGDPILDDLRRVLPDIEGFKITSSSKTELIQRLMVAIEQRQVAWPAGTGSAAREGSEPLSAMRSFAAHSDWPLLTAELKRYEYAIGPSGQISYSAPQGFHDDCVIALALANYRRWETANVGDMLRLPFPLRHFLSHRRTGRDREILA